jgi:hypothetical protein
MENPAAQSYSISLRKLNGKMAVNNEMEKIKKKNMTYFQVLFQHLPEVGEKYHENLTQIIGL